MTASTEVVAERGGGHRRRGRLGSPKLTVGVVIVGVFVVLAIVGPWIAPYDPSASGPDQLAPPSWHHLFGTTYSGQDVLSQILVGTRESMLVGFLAATIGETIAIVVGVTAGYVGGWTDEVLSVITNIVLVIPVLPLQILLAGYVSDMGWFGMTLIIAVTAWPFGARRLRAQTLSLRSRDYIKAAEISGERTWRVTILEILPNLTAIIVTSFLFHVIFAIVVQTSLAFVGVGSLSDWNWGSILYWVKDHSALLFGAWWWYIPPGLCLGLLGLGLGMMTIGIDERMNPRLAGTRGRRRRRAIGAVTPR
jgi:peptide/nickel transport system permease protein